MKAHSPYTVEGRAGLARVIRYERQRFYRMVRATVAERLLNALNDEHARPANAPELRHLFDMIAWEIANGHVAGVALAALQLVEMARKRSAALRPPVSIDPGGRL